MMAISLWQPWATLIADHRKPHETRSFAPPQRLMGRDIAIHAAKHMDLDTRLLAKQWGYDPGTLPHGAIVAVVRLSSCMRTELFSSPPYDAEYGDFTPGRWAWRLEYIRKIRRPIACVGHQGFFPVPELVERQIVDVVPVEGWSITREVDKSKLQVGDRLSESELRSLMRAPK